MMSDDPNQLNSNAQDSNVDFLDDVEDDVFDRSYIGKGAKYVNQ